MASDEDARAAARRIVEEVLARREGADDAAPVTADPEDPAEEPARADTGLRAVELADSAVEDLAERSDAAVPDPQVSEARRRARALVAEVLAAHEAEEERRGAPGARTAPDPQAAAPASPSAPDAPESEVPVADAAGAEDAPPAAGAVDVDVDEDAADDREPTVEDGSPESTSRLRARELVAAAIAEAEARETAAAAEAEEARRAEAEAAAAREREQEAARQLAEALAQEEAERAEREAREREQRERDARAAAEQPERELWAAADHDAASETLRMARQDDEAPAPGPDDTTPLSVAELAAASQAARDDAATSGEGSPDATVAMPALEDPADATAALPVSGGATVAAADDDQPGTAATAVHERTGAVVDEPATTEGGATTGRTEASATVLESGVPVLEAIVELDDAGETRRTGRWLLASVLGAITLAILFPLAINALLRLVSLS